MNFIYKSDKNIKYNMSSKKYQKMDPIQHIITRPDMYVGSTRSKKRLEYVAIPFNDTYKIYQKEISFSPAILRIFVEPLSNAIDNVARSRKAGIPCSKIMVNVDKKTGETRVWNDGDVIPIEKNEEEGCYNHTLIFGHLLTSSNYDDTEERYDISGRNGLGSKNCNVFSTKFTVKGVDPNKGLYFEQTWTNNMKNFSKPIVKKTKLKKGYTEVTWTPDFSQFKLKGYTQDIVSLYCRYVIDSAMLTKLKVYFNDTEIPVKSLQKYAQLYRTDDMTNTDSLYIKTKDSEVVLTPSTEYQTISFANGVYTSLGGVHVDAWREAIFRPLVEKFNKKSAKGKSKPQINIKDVKQFFRIFVNATVKNPEFDSQSKNRLESPSVNPEVLRKHLNAIFKWSVMDNIEYIIRSKEMMVLKKSERKKKGYTKVNGLDDANKAGGKSSTDCTLIICEGDSAKTYAVSGINNGAFDKKGRDWFGIYPLRGKILNVRNAKPTVIASNAVITDLIKAVGLEHNVDYTDDKNFEKLRYGRILILTDSDCDGIHISGLIQNFIHALFPTLLTRKKSFLSSMQTPIVRVFLGNGKQRLFYDERNYKKYADNFRKKYPGKKIDQKYYKGLGSSKDADVQDTFGVKLVEFKNDNDTTTNMNKVFHKKHADSRKTWLTSFDPTREGILSWSSDIQETKSMKISDFIDTEMIKFSIDDCKRSLPNVLDGLKESQRKILYACMRRKLRYKGKALKVAQLGGYVAEHSGYHHGEHNLFETITKMAASFPGSNNIPLLYRDGQFGSRIQGGKDAAQPRYIFTKFEGMTHLIFKEDDTVLLKQVEDDGDKVEPEYYIPILPMILVNGCNSGIGTGWSCSVPNYNPLELINSIKVWLKYDGDVLAKDEEDGTIISILPELKPWYRGFEGEIESNGNGKYTTWGSMQRVNDKKVIVNELPIGYWTDNFKEHLKDMREKKTINKFNDYCTKTKVNVEIIESSDGLKCNKVNLKLGKSVHTTNMVLFDVEGKLRRFDAVDEILDYFCRIRLEYYKKRRKHQLGELESKIKYLGNKRRFLEEVMNGKLKLYDKKVSREEEEIIKDLETRGYDKETKIILNGDDGDDEDICKGFNYLLRMQIRSFTKKNIENLRNEISGLEDIHGKLKKTSAKKLWENDLDDFSREYTKWLKVMEKEDDASNGKKTRKSEK